MLVLFIILCAIILVDFRQNNLIQPEKGTKLIYLSKNVSYLFIFLFTYPHLLIPYSDSFFFSAILLEMDSNQHKDLFIGLCSIISLEFDETLIQPKYSTQNIYI